LASPRHRVSQILFRDAEPLQLLADGLCSLDTHRREYDSAIFDSYLEHLAAPISKTTAVGKVIWFFGVNLTSMSVSGESRIQGNPAFWLS